MPAPDVITKALNLYQTELRKPSITIYCLDFSGSMQGNGESQLKQAMQQILIQENAKKYMLQATKDDVNIVIPFNDRLIDTFTNAGSGGAGLNALYNNIAGLKANGGTDIYSPAVNALDLLKRYDLSLYQPAIVLMTDGQSNTGKNFDDFKKAYDTAKSDVPVFSIMFGDASADQLKTLADYTHGRVFDGKDNLINAFKSVRGYN